MDFAPPPLYAARLKVECGSTRRMRVAFPPPARLPSASLDVASRGRLSAGGYVPRESANAAMHRQPPAAHDKPHPQTA